MANVSGARWECILSVPPHARSMKFAFSANNGWDDDWRRNWIFPVIGATTRAWPPAPVVALGSPVITANPPGELPDNPGDNFDLVMQEPPLRSQEVTRGFGDFGQIWFNADASNLYVGGYGMDIGGSNNVPVIFLDLDTLTDNAWTLWHKTGPPNALDFLHNVRFTEPMDIAILLGDTYGDGAAYTNFDLGGPGGYNFGQGIWYLGTNSAVFSSMPDAQLSQFHGEGTTRCETGGSSANRRTRRWEAALPWTSLNAAGPGSVSNLLVCGVIASSSVQTNDRYLSRVFLGDRAWGLRDEYIQYGFNTIYLRPQRVNFLHADLRGDGLSNSWRLEQFGTPDGPPADEDSDEDGQDNRAEEIAGTRPLDPSSCFAVAVEPFTGGWPGVLTWPFAPGRAYDVFHTPDMQQPFQWRETILNTNRWEVPEPGYFHLRVRKQPPPG